MPVPTSPPDTNTTGKQVENLCMRVCHSCILCTPVVAVSTVSKECAAASVETKNGPAVTAVFECPDSGVKQVVSICALPSGVSEAEFILPDTVDGAWYYNILFGWPAPMYDMKILFENELTTGKLKEDHPMISSLNAELVNHHDAIEAVPQTRIKVNLSIPVQTDSDTFSHRIETIMGPNGITNQVMIAKMNSFETILKR